MARRNKWADQAALDALVRFGPELSGLQALQREALDRYASDVQVARATGSSIRQAIGQARPDVKRIYSGAQDTVDDINAVTQLPADVPASAAAAISQEQSGFQRRMAESKAAALTDLKSRGVAAREGQAFAVQQARSQLGKDLQSLMERRLSLAQEQGAFTLSEASKLRTAAQERADSLASKQATLTQQERNSLRSAGIDPDSGQPIPGGKLDPDANGKPGGSKGSGKKWASQEQHAAAQDSISEAVRFAKTFKEAGLSRAEVAAVLSAGRDGKDIPIHDPRTGKPVYNADGTPKTKKQANVPQIKSQLLLSSALDEVFDGHLSRRNTRLLHSRRLRIQDLPLTTYTEWLRRNSYRPGTILAPGANGQSRPT